MFGFLSDPTMLSVCIITPGGVILTILELRHSKKSNEKAEESVYHCEAFVTRVFEQRLVEAGIISVIDMTICENEECTNCKPTIESKRFEERARGIEIANNNKELADKKARLAGLEKTLASYKAKLNFVDANLKNLEDKAMTSYAWSIVTDPCTKKALGQYRLVNGKTEIRDMPCYQCGTSGNAGMSCGEDHYDIHSDESSEPVRTFTDHEYESVTIDSLLNTAVIKTCECDDCKHDRNKRRPTRLPNATIEQMY